MDTILPSEWPYVIGFIAVVIALFWLIGRAADRGLLSDRRARPAFLVIAALVFGSASVMHALDKEWLGAAIFGASVPIYLLAAWRHRQRT